MIAFANRAELVDKKCLPCVDTGVAFAVDKDAALCVDTGMGFADAVSGVQGAEPPASTTVGQTKSVATSRMLAERFLVFIPFVTASSSAYAQKTWEKWVFSRRKLFGCGRHLYGAEQTAPRAPYRCIRGGVSRAA